MAKKRKKQTHEREDSEGSQDHEEEGEWEDDEHPQAPGNDETAATTGDEPVPAQRVDPELADVQQRAQRLTEKELVLNTPPDPLGRGDSSQDKYDEEKKAGKEAVADAERAFRAADDHEKKKGKTT